MSKNKKQPVVKYPIITVPSDNAIYTQVIISNPSPYNQQVILNTNYYLDYFSDASLFTTNPPLEYNYIIEPKGSLNLTMNSEVDNLNIQCDFISSLKTTQTDVTTSYTVKTITIKPNTLYSNGINLNTVVMLSDLIQFNFKFPDNYLNVKLTKGLVIPKGTTYTKYTNVFVINEELIFMGFDNNSKGTNRFYNAFLEGVPVLIQANVKSNPLLLFVYLPAFFTVYKSKLLINDMEVSKLTHVLGIDKIPVINNTSYTIIVVKNNNESYFMLAGTGTYFHSSSIDILIPSGVQKISQDGYEILTFVDSMPQLETMQIFNMSNSTEGEYDNYYATTNTFSYSLSGRNLGPALNLIPIVTHNDIYNQTNQPVQVIASDGKVYTINVGCCNNFKLGAYLCMYNNILSNPSIFNAIVDTGEFTVIQCETFGPIVPVLMPATDSNIIFNHIDRPVLVTDINGMVHTINVNCHDNFEVGSTIMMYPDFQIINTGYCTNIEFVDNPDNTTEGVYNTMIKTSSNKVFNHTNRPLSVINTNNIVELIDVGCSGDFNVGASIYVFNDCTIHVNSYCTNVMLGDGIISKTGPGMLVAMPKTSSNNIYNGTDRPIRVTSKSGKNYTINSGETGNFDLGAMILLYPLYSINSDEIKTNVVIRPNMYSTRSGYDSKTGPALEVKTTNNNTSNKVCNQTDIQLLITLPDGSSHNIDVTNSMSDVVAGSTLLLYPDMQIVYKDGTTTVQNIDYRLRINFDKSANTGNNYYFTINSRNKHRVGWVLLANLRDPQPSEDFPNSSHMQGFYLDWGNTNPRNVQTATPYIMPHER